MLVGKFVPILNFLADVKTHIEKLLTGKTCEREREVLQEWNIQVVCKMGNGCGTK